MVNSLRYLVPKFPRLMGGVVLTACVAFLFSLPVNACSHCLLSLLPVNACSHCCLFLLLPGFSLYLYGNRLQLPSECVCDTRNKSLIRPFTIFWRSPSHGVKPLGLPSSHQSSHQGAQARPAHPPPPNLARHLRLTNHAALRCQGEGKGGGWCSWAHSQTSFVKVRTQGLATQPTSRSETWQAGQAKPFFGARRIKKK